MTLSISCPVLGGWGGKLQVVFPRRKFPFIRVWQPLRPSSRNISEATAALENTHPSPSPQGKLQHRVPVSLWNPSVFVMCLLPQPGECGGWRCPLTVCIPHTGSEVVCEHGWNKQMSFSWHFATNAITPTNFSLKTCPSRVCIDASHHGPLGEGRFLPK